MNTVCVGGGAAGRTEPGAGAEAMSSGRTGRTGEDCREVGPLG